MLQELKFVQGAIAKKDFLPAMTHFAIEGGRVRAYNGTIALSSPLPFNIDCKPKADPLVRAIGNCEETVTLAMTAAGKLRIQSGKFKAFIDCIEETTAHVEPEGVIVQFDGEAMLAALKVIHPFIGDDASRPWTNGVMLRGQSAFATNNVVAVEYWVGTAFPAVVNVPRVAVREMLRINEAPTHAQLADNSITFHYSDGRWVRSQLLGTEWPDMGKLLDRECNNTPIDGRVFEALTTLKPFVDKLGRVFIENGVLSTSGSSDDEGASYEIPGLPFTGIYQIEMLNLLKDVATHADFEAYPKPCLFFGNRLRGAIVGIRKMER